MAYKRYKDFTPAEKESLRLKLIGMKHRIEYHDLQAFRLRQQRQEYLKFLRARRRMSYPDLAEVSGLTHQGAQYAVKKEVLQRYAD